MKRLTILRHAKSSWYEPNRDDFDRPLNERGRKAARRIGRELNRRKMDFDFALASAAARVRETLDGVAETFGEFRFPVRFDRNVYLASAATLLDLIHDLPGDAQRALLVGHNPGLQRLIVELTVDDRDGLRQRVADKYPTAALAVVELPAEQWRDVSPGSGKLLDLILPKELD
jgi:phosphohistidine phosphatase